MPSILQDWVTTTGLRHQGVLMAAVRGCDTLPRPAAAKTIARYYRESHCNQCMQRAWEAFCVGFQAGEGDRNG
jgi:hypothetical protein